MKNIKLNTSRKAGFSLTEMLVVIAIVGLIAAIAIPNINALNKEKTKTAGQAPALTEPQNSLPNPQPIEGQQQPDGINNSGGHQPSTLDVHTVARDLATIYNGYAQSKFNPLTHQTLADKLQAINVNTEANVNSTAIVALRGNMVNADMLKEHLLINEKGLLKLKDTNGTALNTTGAGGNDKI